MTILQSLVRNRRAFLRVGVLATGVAALAACGVGATTKSRLTDAERAVLEAKGEQMAADVVAGEITKTKGAARLIGIVKFYNDYKGYGFIVGESGKDLFVHYSQARDDLREGDTVCYEQELSYKKGLHAINVRLC